MTDEENCELPPRDGGWLLGVICASAIEAAVAALILAWRWL